MFDIAKDELYTIAEAAEKLRISRKLFEIARKDGNGPTCVVIDERVRFTSTALNKYIINQNPHLVEGSEVLSAAAIALGGK